MNECEPINDYDYEQIFDSGYDQKRKEIFKRFQLKYDSTLGRSGTVGVTTKI